MPNRPSNDNARHPSSSPTSLGTDHPNFSFKPKSTTPRQSSHTLTISCCGGSEPLMGPAAGDGGGLVDLGGGGLGVGVGPEDAGLG